MRNVSKQIFLNALVCPTLGWLTRAEQLVKTPTLCERFLMEQGMEIGKRARELYPDGILIHEKDTASASKKTKSLMNDPGASILFEGTFLVDRFSVKADILKRKGDGWYMIEVKSSVNDKEEFIDDMAYTAMVMERSGFNISNVSLMLISKDFRLGMKNEKLFVEIDHTDEVRSRVEEFKPVCEQVEKITRMPSKPEPNLRFECRKCELFKDCLGRDIENHIYDLPRLSQSKFDKLMESGIVCIEDIPDGFPLTENQARVKDCVQLKKVFTTDRLKSELESVSWPAFYLDFETVTTAIPLYPDIAPYTQLPTQYSIHKCSKPGHIIDHLEYLANPSRDCRRELAENLINDLKGESSIIVYSNFEKTILNSLARAYPELSRELNLVIGRLVDLEVIIRKNLCHPNFHGSTSLKKTLPVLVPDMSYDGLEITDGGTAMAVFAFLALGKYEGGELERTKRSLLVYCRQDTLATVKLHERLLEHI